MRLASTFTEHYRPCVKGPVQWGFFFFVGVPSKRNPVESHEEGVCTLTIRSVFFCFVLFCFVFFQQDNWIKKFQPDHMLVDNMKYLILARCEIFPRLFRLCSKNCIKVWTSTPHQKFLDPSFAFDNDSKTMCWQPVRFKKRHTWLTSRNGKSHVIESWFVEVLTSSLW